MTIDLKYVNKSLQRCFLLLNAGRFNATINIALSFILWIVAAFSVAPLVNLELNTGTLLLLWLALWTGANIFHDAWNLLKAATSRIRKDLE